MSKRAKWTVCAGLLGSLCLGAAPAPAAEITLAVWGGHYGDSFKKYFAEPFEKKTGVSVNVVFGNCFSNYQKLTAQKDHPQLDVVALCPDTATQGVSEGLLEALDPKEFPNLRLADNKGIRMTPDNKVKYAPLFLLAFGINYRTDLTPFAITSWNDLWDPRLANKVAVVSSRAAASEFLLLVNQLAGGKAPDIKPGIDKMKAMGKNLLVIEDTDARQLQLLSDGEVWAATGFAGTATDAIAKGLKAKFVVPKEGGIGFIDGMALVKNAPNGKDAKRFIDFALQPENLTPLIEALNAAPTEPSIHLSPEGVVRSGLSEEERAHVIVFDEQMIIDNRAAWSETWDREIVPMTKR